MCRFKTRYHSPEEARGHSDAGAGPIFRGGAGWDVEVDVMGIEEVIPVLVVLQHPPSVGQGDGGALLHDVTELTCDLEPSAAIPRLSLLHPLALDVKQAPPEAAPR